MLPIHSMLVSIAPFAFAFAVWAEWLPADWRSFAAWLAFSLAVVAISVVQSLIAERAARKEFEAEVSPEEEAEMFRKYGLHDEAVVALERRARVR